MALLFGVCFFLYNYIKYIVVLGGSLSTLPPLVQKVQDSGYK